MITEKPDAKQFEFKGGEIEFRNVGFKHLATAVPKAKGAKGSAQPKEEAINDTEPKKKEFLFRNLNLKI